MTELELRLSRWPKAARGKVLHDVTEVCLCAGLIRAGKARVVVRETGDGRRVRYTKRYEDVSAGVAGAAR